MRPNVKGRMTKVRIRGGRRVVYGRVARRKDYVVEELALIVGDVADGGKGLRRTCGCPIIAR